MSAEAWYVGFDLGSKRHEVVICNERGEPVRQFGMPRGQRGWERLRREVGSVVPPGMRVRYMVEAAQNFWQEVVHPLKTAGEEVYLLSPTKCSDLRKFYRKHTKTDAIDALATARVGLSDRNLVPVWVGTPEQGSLRRLCRLSWKLSEEMRNQKRRIATQLEMVLPGIGTVWRNRYCGSAKLFYRRYLDPARARRVGRKRLEAMLRRRAWGKFSSQTMEKLWAVIENAPALRLRRDDLLLEIQCELDGLEATEKRQRALNERIDELYSEVDPARRLESTRGLGPVFAAAITSAIGDVSRWRNANRLVAASGLVPRKKASSGREKANQPLTKQGDPQLRCWLYVAAEIARQYDPELRAFYLRLTRRGLHHKAAICALGAKLLRRFYALLRDQVDYRVTGEAAIQNAKKPIRASVHEVAERLLKDEPEAASYEPEDMPKGTSIATPGPKARSGAGQPAPAVG